MYILDFYFTHDSRTTLQFIFQIYTHLYRSFAFLFCGNNSSNETRNPGLRLWSPVTDSPATGLVFLSMATAGSQGDEFVCGTVKDHRKYRIYRIENTMWLLITLGHCGHYLHTYLKGVILCSLSFLSRYLYLGRFISRLVNSPYKLLNPKISVAAES